MGRVLFGAIQHKSCLKRYGAVVVLDKSTGLSRVRHLTTLTKSRIYPGEIV